MDERQFFTEKTETQAQSLSCPTCKQVAEYPIRWIRRTKKPSLPSGANEQDRARYKNARDYMKAEANVAFPGYISDTRTLYHGLNTIFVAPLFSGTGQRVKLLEAFAMGCPVVTTRVGAMGFPVEDGSQALIAETTDGFEAALRRLAADATLRRDMGNKARAMILEHFTWFVRLTSARWEQRYSLYSPFWFCITPSLASER